MNFGLFSLMTQRDSKATPQQVFADMVDQVRLAESIGFDIAWFAEHHFSNYCLCPSPLTMATYLSGLTKRIRLGTAVIVAPLYQPLRILEDLAVLDCISGGRAVVGLGSGYQQYEFNKFGIELESGRARFFETLDVLEQFLRGGSVEYSGKHIRITKTNFSLRLVQQRPSIYVAGFANDPEMQGRIARQGYVPFFTTGWNTLEQLRTTQNSVRAHYVTAGGNAACMPYAIQQYIFVTDDRSEARLAADGARYIRRVATAMRNRSAKLNGAFIEESPAPDEPSLNELTERMVIGDPHSVAEKLIAECEALDPSHISCFMALAGIEQRRTLRSMERFGAEVMPLIDKHFGGLDRIGVCHPTAHCASAPLHAAL